MIDHNNNTMSHLLEVRIPIATLVRGKVHSFEIPDYREHQQIVSEIGVVKYHTNDFEDQLYPIELKLLSNGTPLMSFTRTYLRTTNANIHFRDSRSLEASSNLSLQIKSQLNCKDVEVVIKYRQHLGSPVFQTEQALSGLEESHTNFWATLVRELKKFIVTKIEFIPNFQPDPKLETDEITSLIIFDPYQINPSDYHKPYRLELNRLEHGVFEIEWQLVPPVQDLLRAKIECKNKNNEHVTCNEIGIIVYGFPK